MPRLQTLILAGLISLNLLKIPCATAQVQPPAGVDNLSHSATLPQDRRRTAELATAERHIRDENYTQAVHVLQRLLDAKEDSFLVANDRYGRLKDYVHVLLAQMPTAGLDSYERQVGPVASEMLAAARQDGRMQALLEVVDRYRQTQAGLSALRELAARKFDCGDFAAAASGYRAVLDHPRTSRADDRLLLLKLIVCHQRTDDARQADYWWTQYRERFGTAPIVIGGKLVRPSEWLQLQGDGAVQQAAFSTPAAESQFPALADIPASLPVWQYRFHSGKEIRDLAADALVEMQDQGITALSSSVPVVTEGLVFVRAMNRVLALDTAKGELVWESEPAGESTRTSDSPERLNNPGFRQMIADALVRDSQMNTLQGTFSHDAHNLYVVEDPGLQSADHRSGDLSADSTQNHLAAYELTSGRLVWRLEGTDAPTPPEWQKMSFLSPPLAFEGMLYVLVQADAGIRLLAMSPQDGSILWWLPIADLPGESASDSRRLGLACPLVVADGCLYCPTAAGVVVAVDLFTRTRVWAVRYSRDDLKPVAELQGGVRNRNPQRHWSRGWRRVTIAVNREHLILASPESDFLHAFLRETGRRAWKRPRGDGLLLADTSDDALLIVERYSVCAIDAATGQTRWRTDTGTPAGSGYLSERDYVLPLASGRIAALNLADGTLRKSFPATPQDWGNLVAFDGGVVTHTHEGVALLPSLESARAQTAAALNQNADERDTRLRQALLDREAGEFGSAIAALTRLNEDREDPEAGKFLRSTLLAELREHPARRRENADKLFSMLDGARDRIELLHASAKAAQDEQHWLEALTTRFQLLELNPAGEVVASAAPKRLVRYNRQVQGEIADLLAQADADALDSLEAAFARHLQAARNSQDPMTLHRFADRFSRLPWGRLVRIKLAPRAGAGVGFLESELSLLELAGTSNETTAAAALHQLAQLMDARSYRTQAAHYYRRLLREFPDVPLQDGRNAQQVLDDLPRDSLLAAAVLSKPADPWPQGQPAVAMHAVRNDDVPRIPVPVQAPRGSLLDRLSVSVDRKGQLVRFQGAEYPRAWEVELPRSGSSFRALYHLHRAWGVGHLAVLQVGTELFAVSPLDDNGETNAQVLWTIDLLGDARTTSNQFQFRTRQARLGFGEQQVTVYDRFDRPMALVGPVRPGYLCYRSGNKLTAVETASGHRLWTRHDIPSDAEITGDEEVLIISQPGAHHAEILRTIDGKTIGRQHPNWTANEVVLRSARFVLIDYNSDERYTLEHRDLTDGRLSWSRTFSPGTHVFAVDLETCGVLESDGTLHFMSLRSGESIAAEQVDVPAELTQILVHVDEHRIFVLLSGPMTQPAVVRSMPMQMRPDWRYRLVNGPLYGFDRRTGHRLWSTVVEDAGFSFDQPAEAPFLVFTHQPVPEDGKTGANLPGALRCLDKRTGKSVFETTGGNVVGDFLTDVMVEHRWVDLKMANVNVRFDFTKKPPGRDEPH
jgi:outer membrane protein assembly factor BamB